MEWRAQAHNKDAADANSEANPKCGDIAINSRRATPESWLAYSMGHSEYKKWSKTIPLAWISVGKIIAFTFWCIFKLKLVRQYS